MIFRELRHDDGWIVINYTTTWDYGYDFMLEAAQEIIDNDFMDDTQRIAVSELAGAKNEEVLDEVGKYGMQLRRCPETAKECGVLTVAGISREMNCPFQLVFFNRTNRVRLFSPDEDYFSIRGERAFDNYLNGVEIRAYCRDTERRMKDQC